MRDTRKDKAYFEKYLDYQYLRIEKKSIKLKEANEEKKQRILVSLTGFEIDLLKAEFSVGASKEKLKKLLNKAITIASEYKNITYEDLLNLLSLAVMLNDKDEACKLIKSNTEMIEKDRLLKFLSLYIQDNKPVWDRKLELKSDFLGLDKIFGANDKESRLIEYLSSWYENHLSYGWFDSHKGSSDTYCGYWSFESAAIVIILGIDDSKLKDSIYYPSI